MTSSGTAVRLCSLLNSNSSSSSCNFEIVMSCALIKRDHLSTITLGWINTRKDLSKTKYRKRIRILFDSGCEATLVIGNFLTHLKKKKVKNTTWTTKAGSFVTKEKCDVTFTLPEYGHGIPVVRL